MASHSNSSDVMEFLESIAKDQRLQNIFERNSFHYNLLKSSEELQELSLVLTQKQTKPGAVNDSEIVDEIGDVLLRMLILTKIYNCDDIKARILFKLTKSESFLKENPNLYF